MKLDDLQVYLIRLAVSNSSETRSAIFSALDGMNLKVVDNELVRFLDLARKYHEETGAAIIPEVADKYAPLIEAFDPLDDPSMPYWVVAKINEISDENDLGNLLVKAIEILRVGSKEGHGFSDALQFVNRHLPTGMEPDGVEEHVALKTQYRKRKGQGSTGIPTGFGIIDNLTDGQQPGEMFVVGAYTGQGKSFFLQNVAYHRKMLGYHGLYWTTEQSVAQILRRMVVRHSSHPMFGLEGGLYDNDVKRARLDEEKEAAYYNVIDDFNANPQYGSLRIKVAPAFSSIRDLMQKSILYSKDHPVDYIIIDYLSQLSPSSGGTGDTRQALTRLFIEAKSLALNFGNRPIALFTAGQTNPDSFDRAVRNGYYTIRAIADSAEAERSSDLLMYLLRRPEDVSNHRLRAGVLKYRDGEDIRSFEMVEDFARCAILDEEVPDEGSQFWSIA